MLSGIFYRKRFLPKPLPYMGRKKQSEFENGNSGKILDCATPGYSPGAQRYFDAQAVSEASASTRLLDLQTHGQQPTEQAASAAL
jgi:hypothetical protein